MDNDLLRGKRVLVVDDEPDILEALEELLDMCAIDKATGFEDAVLLLEQNTYDASILDIMGVNGYSLLEITTGKGIPTLMLTAHALSPDNFVKAIGQGANAYIPKDKITDIEIFLRDILESHEKGSGVTGKWFERLEAFFEKKFGAYWKEKAADPDFWKKHI